MTQISGFIAPTRRPGALGVHSLDHFCLAVPDLEAARRFYAAFGLEVRERGNALDLHTDTSPHRWGSLVEGPRKRLHHLSFGAFEDDFDRLRQRLEGLGVARIDPPAGMDGNGIWFQDSDGNAVEIRVAEKSSPNAKLGTAAVSSAAGVRGTPPLSQTTGPKPRRMSHVLMFARDVARSVAFYSDALGLRLSDEAGGVIAFMHGIHGSDHHLLAFAKSAAPGYHHSSWDVASVNDIGLGAVHMADQGYSKGWGVGRHMVGSNYFHYVADPWGSWAEYGTDIDYIPADQDWQAGSHVPHDAFKVWGPEPPADFVANAEA
jgi:catechol 2,3-dioxygenase-like lactoylglutathione lyase family enzyme